MFKPPTGTGRLSQIVRDLDARIRRLEPKAGPGKLLQSDPTGVNLRPKNLLAGNSSGAKPNSLPRYR